MLLADSRSVGMGYFVVMNQSRRGVRIYVNSDLPCCGKLLSQVMFDESSERMALDNGQIR